MCVCELCVSSVSGDVFGSEAVVVCMCVKFVCVSVCGCGVNVLVVCEVSVRSYENPGGSMKLFVCLPEKGVVV